MRYQTMTQNPVRVYVFIVYSTKISKAQIVQVTLVGRFVNNEWKMTWKEASWSNVEEGVCLEVLRRIVLSTIPLGRDLSPGPSESQSGILTTTLLHRFYLP